MTETITKKITTKDELKSVLDNAPTRVQVVNVLDPQYYNLGSIKGSVKIPLAELETRSSELDKSMDVVTYCAGGSCEASAKAAELLAAKGFKVSAYEGGMKEWTAAGFPVEITLP